MARYSKALAALLAGAAGAAVLLPSDAPTWLLGLGVAVQTVAVYLAPRNASARPDSPQSTAPY